MDSKEWIVYDEAPPLDARALEALKAIRWNHRPSPDGMDPIRNYIRQIIAAHEAKIDRDAAALFAPDPFRERMEHDA